jgi:hypothetical protein
MHNANYHYYCIAIATVLNGYSTNRYKRILANSYTFPLTSTTPVGSDVKSLIRLMLQVGVVGVGGPPLAIGKYYFV